MIIAALFIITENWERLKYPSVDEWMNCSISTQANTTQLQKGTNDWDIQLMDESQLHYADRWKPDKWLQEIWFHLYHILPKGTIGRREQQSLPEIRVRELLATMGQHRDLGVMERVYSWSVVLVTGVYALVKTQNCMLRMVNSTTWIHDAY